MNPNTRINRQLFNATSCVLLLSLLIAACGGGTPPPITEQATQPPEAVVTEPPASSKPLSGLDANPQRVEFQAEDGKNLVGYYYPSKYADAPIVVLMHWAGGDLTDWCKIAPWLQNRGDENPPSPERCANAGAGLPEDFPAPWLDSAWFPPMNANASFAVFAFDFRDYGESEAGGGGPDWAKDAKAAFVTAAELEGVDASRMAAAGASIGADGAADGCLLYNQEAGGGCVGAFSLSPGNYLGMAYKTTVQDLGAVPVWCLAAEGDVDSFAACSDAGGEAYRAVLYPGIDLHGMSLIAPELDPQPLVLIQDFLELAFGETAK
ncbi:MAG: hypothetical protein ACOYZ8_14730 [Chloroflexota bacterium]